MKMMKMTMALVGGLMLLSTTASADPATYKARLQEALKLEEQRIHELEGIEKHDVPVAKELYALAEAKVRAADAYAGQAKAFTDAAALSTGAEKAELLAFAKEEQVYADHDRAFAQERKKAAEIVERQAHDCAEGVKNHQATIERIKTKLATLK